MACNRKKGITISEICIVLAVVSIVSLAVVSFAAMATGRGATSTDKLKVMQDIELLEAVVDQWFAEVYEQPGDVEIIDDNKVLRHKSKEGVMLRFADTDADTDLTAAFPLAEGETETKPRTYRFEVITGLTFAVIESENDDIFFCTVTYAYRRGQSGDVPGTYTFCVNPRVGEQLR